MVFTTIDVIKPGHIYMQWIVAVVVSSTLFTYGLQSGWTSPTIKLLRSSDNPEGYPFTETTISWIASVFCISAVFSTPLYSILADKYGRKWSIIIITITQTMVWIIKIVSADPISLIIARIMTGIAGGGVFSVVPVYVKEISEDNIRGAVGTTVMLFQSVGIMVMYAMGSYLDYYTVLWIVTGIPVLNGLLLLKAPESPSYLVKKGKIHEATKIVAFLRGRDEDDRIVANEVNNMKKEEEQYSTLPNISMKEILTNPIWRKGVLISAILMTLSDSCGNFAIMTYAASIVSASGVTLNPELQTMSFPAVMSIGSLVSMLFIEKYGRKPLIIISLLATGLSLSALAAVQLVQEQGGWMPGWLPIVSIITSVFFYGAGLLPVPFVVMSEMFNFQMRAKIVGYVVTYGWFLGFLQIFTFGPISAALGMYTMFFIFAGVTFVGAILCFIYLPETKGKTIEEIENALAKRNNKDLKE